MDLYVSGYSILADKSVSIDGEMYYEDRSSVTDSEFLITLYRYAKIAYPKFFKMDALSKTGFLVSELLLDKHSLSAENTKPSMGMVFSNSMASLDTDINYQQTIGAEYFPSPSVFVYTLPNIVMGEIAIRHKIHGENTFFVSKEFDTDLITTYTQTLFAEGDLEQALVAWVEYFEDKATCMMLLVNKQQSGIVFNAAGIKKIFTV